MDKSNTPDNVVIAYDKESTRHTIVFILMTYDSCLKLCTKMNLQQGRYVFSTLEQSQVNFYMKHSSIVYNFESLDGIEKVSTK